MPSQDQDTQKPQTTPTTDTKPPKVDFGAVKDAFSKAPPAEQQKFLMNLKDDERADFAEKMGWTMHATGMQASPAVGSIPWMKEKAYAGLTWGANQLPAIMGTGGGIVGGVIGGAINPLGGEGPGAVIGAGILGAAGEAGRQGVLHAEGYDKYEGPKTMVSRIGDMSWAGGEQAASELGARGLTKWLRPTLDRSIAKLYYAGNLDVGEALGKGDVETVIHDLLRTEKATGKAVTLRDFVGVIGDAKKDIGQQVDIQMALPITQNGQAVMLGQAHANPAAIITAIKSKAHDPSIVKLAGINKAGKEAAYLARVDQEALNFQQHPWTYAELADRRIHLNQELAPIYALPKGEQRIYLLEHPDLAFKKAEAEAIRDTVYPVMDHLSNKPKGTTRALQNKRGALMSLEDQATKHLGNLRTTTLKAQGANPWDKINASGYVTSSGKPGGAIHRVTSLFHTPNDLARADTQVKSAFGHGAGPNIRRVITTPFGSKTAGDQILALPLRELVNPSIPAKPEDEDTPDGPQSSVAPVASPRELIERAKGLNPAATGQTAYNHLAVHPVSGHRVGSIDGKTWFDVQTGAKVA